MQPKLKHISIVIRNFNDNFQYTFIKSPAFLFVIYARIVPIHNQLFYYPGSNLKG